MNEGLLFDIDAFCSWLAEREADIVGYPGIGYSDPLSEWLSSVASRLYGVEGAVYGPIALDDCYWRRLPLWARLFFNFTERYMFLRPVTGAEAFQALAEIERQYSASCNVKGCVPLWLL